MPTFDIVLGPRGQGTSVSDQVLVSLAYKPRYGSGSFMVISGKGRPADDRTLCGRALDRAEVIGTFLANEVFSLVDALWLTEPQMNEIRALDNILDAAADAT